LEKTKTSFDVMFWFIFKVIVSITIAYIAASFILYRADPNAIHIFLPIKVLISRSVLIFNNNSGMFYDNPGADVLIYAIVSFICTFLAINLILKNSSNSEFDNFQSKIYGESRFATIKEIKTAGLFKKSGVIYGEIEGR
jgi:type IV secretory pathway TraG/TraD family ATPase VirD4